MTKNKETSIGKLILDILGHDKLVFYAENPKLLRLLIKTWSAMGLIRI